MIAHFSLALSAALLAAACAPAARNPPLAAGAETGRDCFFLAQVSGFTSAGKGSARYTDRILVSTGPSEKYLFETFGSCPDLNFTETLAFDQNGPGRICRGMDVDLIVPGAGGPRRCPVGMIRKLTKAEEAAL